MKYPIRAAQSDDLQAILLLLKECDLPFEDISADHLAHFQVLANGEAVIGCIGIERRGSDALLRSLAVYEFLRGDGRGPQLLHAMEIYANSIGVSALYLLTTTAATFFEERGYHRIDRADAPVAMQETSQFSRLCPSSSTCLFKSIPAKTLKEMT